LYELRVNRPESLRLHVGIGSTRLARFLRGVFIPIC